MRLLAFIVALAFGLAMLAPKPDMVQPAAPVAVASVTPASPAPINGGDFTLTRAPDGHFYTDAQVNGTVIRMLVDTGASSVALSKADAAKIGLQFSDADFTETGQGAGGKIALKPIMLDRIIIGTTDAANVEGVIVGGDLSVSLLGQSWLKRVGTVEIKGDKLVLR